MPGPETEAAPARVAVVGAGRMGRGLAQVFAYAGHQVALLDLKPRDPREAGPLLGEARAEVARGLEMLVGFGLLSPPQAAAALARIGLVPEPAADAALGEADVVFEAVPERLDAKQPALRRISGAAPAAALIASTTSTMLVDTLAGFVAGPERFLNAHWLNPAFLIPLVEVSPGAATAPEATRRMTALLTAAGKVPVTCAARPGFIVPRIQALAMNEAARLVEEGVASAEDVDRAIRVGFGVRFAVLGMLEFIDWGGGDILYYASEYLKDALPSARHEPPEVVRRNMAEGRLGIGAGRGFYDFSGVDVDAYRRERLGRFVDLLRHLDLLAPPDSALKAPR